MNQGPRTLGIAWHPFLIALLNLTGLGLGYLYMKRWVHWGIHIVCTAGLLILAFWTHASHYPIVWWIAFGLWLLWMAFDGWRQARKFGWAVNRPWLPIVMALLLAGLEIAGLWLYREFSLREFVAGMSAFQEAECGEAMGHFYRVSTTYELTLSPEVKAAEARFTECSSLFFAKDARSAGDLEMAVAGYENYLSTYPDGALFVHARDAAAETYEEWAAVLQDAGDYGAVVETYSAILAKYPDAPAADRAGESAAGAYVAWADQLRGEGDYGVAIEKYRNVLAQYRDTSFGAQAAALAAETYAQWATQLREDGDYEAAVEAYRALLLSYPETSLGARAADLAAETYGAWAYQLRQDGDYQEAIDRYQAALDDYPHTPQGAQTVASIADTYGEWAAQLRSDGEFQQAIDVYETLLARHPQTSPGRKAAQQVAEVYAEWASRLRKEEQYEAAIDKYETILQSYPQTRAGREAAAQAAETYGEAAALQRREGAFGLAIRCYESILQDFADTPTGEQAAVLIAEIYVEWAGELRQGAQYEDAVETYQALLDTYPDTPSRQEAVSLIAETYAAWAAHLDEEGKFSGAAAKYQNILDAYSNTPTAAEIKPLLAESYAAWADQLFKEGNRGEAIGKYGLVLAQFAGTDAAVATRSTLDGWYGQATQALAENRHCDALPILRDFAAANALYASEARGSLPKALYQCGLANYDAGQFTTAIRLYEELISNHPSSSLVSRARSALVDARVADLMGGETGELPPPQVSGSAPAGTARVVISNDSPERLEILLSGPGSKSQVIAQCDTCEKYFGIGPVFCPEKGPRVTIDMVPGTYKVVVRAVDEPTVTPWSGTWTLGSGKRYFHCFFIVTRFGG